MIMRRNEKSEQAWDGRQVTNLRKQYIIRFVQNPLEEEVPWLVLESYHDSETCTK